MTARAKSEVANPFLLDLALPQSGQASCPFDRLSPDYQPADRKNDFVLVSDSEQVKEVLLDIEHFLPSNALTAVTPLQPAALRILLGYGFALPEVLASATGQLHRSVRRTVASFFTPARVRAQEEVVRKRVRSAANSRFRDQNPVFHEIPISVMQELTGVNRQIYEVQGLTYQSLELYSLESLELFWGWPDQERQIELAHSAGKFYRSLRALVRECEGQKGTLFGALLQQGIDLKRVVSLAYFLAIAGQYTTCLLMNSILYSASLETAGGVRSFSVFERAREHVQGVLRDRSSVPTWRRQAGAGAQLAGCPVAAGTEILLEVSGTESSDYRLAFGWGLHRCLGALLAESECTWMLHEFALWLEAEGYDCRVVSQPHWLNLLSYRAPLNLALSLTPQREG